MATKKQINLISKNIMNRFSNAFLKLAESEKPNTFVHNINLDERGSYYATVTAPNNAIVFKIKAGDLLEEGESSIFDDGFMKHKGDMAGLKDYLISLGIMAAKDVLTDCK